MSDSKRILLKVRPSAAMAAAGSPNLQPLSEQAPAAGSPGLAAAPAWYVADLPEAGPTPWDSAHLQLADRLGLAASDLLFAEPDLAHSYPGLNERHAGDQPFAVNSGCPDEPQQSGGGRATGPGLAWHLKDDYSQLGSARDLVQFTDPRTRIAHIDTGYDKSHSARPERILQHLERNFVDGNNQPGSAADPYRGRLFDNSGHGTGTLGILAGGKMPQHDNVYLGGAPEAEIVPLRVADSVVLFYTSALAQAIRYAVQQQCDVISLSMGGLPSRAWNEAVNEAYEAGVCIAAASGDCFGGLPTHHVVYPARYRRTITVCGVMADGRPYYDLDSRIIEGNWGPDSCMTAALSSYAPNIPWAKFGCGDGINHGGQGTSAATPQVAAAAALWYERHKSALPRDWRRVEAVRNALFTSARPADPKYFGRGILQAKAALALSPVLNLPKTPADRDSFSFFRVLTGLGITETPREAMFNLELTQRWLMNPELQRIVADPEVEIPREALRRFMEAVVDDSGASLALRKQMATRYTLVFGSSVQGAPAEVAPSPRPVSEATISVPDPPFRRLRAYAVDPSFSASLGTADFNEVVLKVKWETLKPGPVGEYLEVLDTDAAGQTYEPVDLNTPCLLAQDGFAPAEGHPGFHQQMTYAVAMTTIAHFERALGRPVLWRPRPDPQDESDDRHFTRRLR
ncbi:MAG TPA: S8 family serine peptidase, partial [Blastocatellia bacterium]|nr:S8 family serine peptidase [Blastocatellia bacterium]